MRGTVWLCLLALAAEADVAERMNGVVVRGEIELLEKNSIIRYGKKKKTAEPSRAFFLVERDDGVFVWSRGFRSRIGGYVALVRAEQRTHLARLTKEAVLKARDHELARRLLDRALEAGLTGKNEESLTKRVKSLEDKPKKPRPEEVVRIKAELKKVDAIPGEWMTQRAKAAMKNRALGLRILREALRRDPSCAPALALLKEEAPEKFALGDARAWLDWRLDIERHGFKPATGDELELKRARHHWRPDLYGVGSKEIFLITAMKDFELVGRCLQNGELVCRALQSLFVTDKPVRRDPAPLTLFLYADAKAYKDNAADYRDIDNRAFLSWSTGHFSSRDNITRFYWPTDPDDERRFLYVFRRELADHWMHARNPAYSVGQANRAWRAPANWLEIGLISVVARARYDTAVGTWDFFNPRCVRLDGFTAASRQQPGKLLDWPQLLLMSHETARDLPDKTNIEIVRRWSLSTRLYSEYHIYLAQGTAAFRYLFHTDDGKHRDALLKAVVAHYRGEGPKTNPKGAFGMNPDEIGMRTLEFATQVAEGWKPEATEPRPPR